MNYNTLYKTVAAWVREASLEKSLSLCVSVYTILYSDLISSRHIVLMRKLKNKYKLCSNTITNMILTCK